MIVAVLVLALVMIVLHESSRRASKDGVARPSGKTIVRSAIIFLVLLLLLPSAASAGSGPLP